jgi:hypothetical protein
MLSGLVARVQTKRLGGDLRLRLIDHIDDARNRAVVDAKQVDDDSRGGVVARSTWSRGSVRPMVMSVLPARGLFVAIWRRDQLYGGCMF